MILTNKILTPSKIAVIEWYDSIFSGLVRFNELDSWMLINLVCYVSETKKMYVLKVISDEDVSRLQVKLKYNETGGLFWKSDLALSMAEFSVLKTEIAAILRDTRTPIFVGSTEDIAKDVTIVKMAPLFAKDLPFEIEDVMELSEEQKDYRRSLIAT